MRRTFKGEENQHSFETLGYIMINSFISQEEVAFLRAQYFNLEHDLGQGFHATMHSRDIDYRRRVNELISEIFTPKARLYLDNYRQLVSNYTVKEPGGESFFDFHLDWNMVDETQSRSVTIWCPLEDTNSVNGNLWILESSNTLGNSYRCGPGLCMYFENPKELRNSRFLKKELRMKAGDAIIYDHKLFHGSPANRGDEPRVAINQAMIAEEFTSIHYLSEKKGDVIAAEVDDDFYCRCIIGEQNDVSRIVTHHKLKSSPTPQKLVNKMIK